MASSNTAKSWMIACIVYCILSCILFINLECSNRMFELLTWLYFLLRAMSVILQEEITSFVFLDLSLSSPLPFSYHSYSCRYFNIILF